MAVEYTIPMIFPPSSPPLDLGIVLTLPIHCLLASTPTLNTLLAALKTVFVLMQTGYILWTWIIEGRPRATISTLFMFTFRGILGYSTQLPLLEVVRLLSTRGNYAIDLVVGVDAGILFDSIAGKYEESKKLKADSISGTTCGSFFSPSKQ